MKFKVRKFLKKIFGGIDMTWKRVIIFAIIAGVYTALMAMLVPDGNSFHDIAVLPEAWVLLAILIIVNCKTPLDAALKTFVFFLISQPLVYLIQVPFNSMGWGLFGYYKYWFMVTLATFPGAFVAWFIKKDKWYSGVILSVATVLLVWIGVDYAKQCLTSFPNHLLSTIYCFGIIPVFILTIFKDKVPRIITALASLAMLIALLITNVGKEEYEVYRNDFVTESGITFVGEPYVSSWATTGMTGNVEVIKMGENEFNYKIRGFKGERYNFCLSDDTDNEYCFDYWFAKDMNMVEVKKVAE